MEENYIANGQAYGDIAGAISSGVNLAKYRSFESLPQRAWEYIDESVQRIMKEELNGIGDLQNTPGVVVPFDGLGASVFTMYRTSGLTDAEMSMSPDARGDADTIDFKSVGIPLPVTVKNFPVNTKQVAMASRENIPLQSILYEEALYKLAYKLESFLFNGTYTAAGATAYGYTTFPDRNEYDIAVSWSTASPDLIFADANSMVQASIDSLHYGPWVMYIPPSYTLRMNQDYLTATSEYPLGVTIKQRIEMIPGVQVKTAKFLATDNVVLVEMKPTTVKLIEGISPTVVDWTMPAAPTWTHNFKALAMQVPLLLSDYDGNCGIVHGWMMP